METQMTPWPSTNGAAPRPAGPLAGIRVLDVATIFAGPLAATLLGDSGADVIKVEHPRGDPLRHHGHTKDGHGLWWKVVSRNKRSITLNLSTTEGQELFCRLAAAADVVVENFRPGVMERWNLGYETLSRHNPGLIMLRVTGFGQYGPYASRRGFGTLAEAMSGFAHITGEEDGPPTLPPFGLADGIAGLTAAYATMTALYHRDQRGGQGQVVDVAIIEPILTILGAQPTVHQQLGHVQRRIGNRTPNNAPRNTYESSDGRWIAISTSANPVAERLMHRVGRPDLIEKEWFATSTGRAAHTEELDEVVGGWIKQHTETEVLAALEEAGAAAAPVYDVSQVVEDPQYRELGSIVEMEDEDLGMLRMTGLLYRMSSTPGAIRHTGRRLGQDNAAVYGELGVTSDRLDELKDAGVV